MKYNDHSVDVGRRHYYSSSQGPFRNANNIYMFYGGGDRGKIVENVISGVNNKEPIVHVHGETGSGKTMLSLVISDRIKHRFHTMRYDLPELSAGRLLRHLLIELAPHSSDLITHEQAQSGADEDSTEKALRCLEQQLSKAHPSERNKPYIVFVDSKDTIDTDVMNVIHRLNRCRANEDHVFYTVIFHTSANDAESCSAMSNMLDHSDNHHWLRRLTLAEVNEYLHHHMLLFDFNRRNLFTREMACFIADSSEGVFKSINAIARNALTIANRENEDVLSLSHLITAGSPLSEQPTDAPKLMDACSPLACGLMGSWLLACVALVVYLIGW